MQWFHFLCCVLLLFFSGVLSFSSSILSFLEALCPLLSTASRDRLPSFCELELVSPCSAGQLHSCCPGNTFAIFLGIPCCLFFVGPLVFLCLVTFFFIYSLFLMECLLGSSWEKGCGGKFIRHCISENSFSFTLDRWFGWLLERKTCFLRMLKPVNHCFLASKVPVKKCCKWSVFCSLF